MQNKKERTKTMLNNTVGAVVTVSVLITSISSLFREDIFSTLFVSWGAAFLVLLLFLHETLKDIKKLLKKFVELQEKTQQE